MSSRRRTRAGASRAWPNVRSSGQPAVPRDGDLRAGVAALGDVRVISSCEPLERAAVEAERGRGGDRQGKDMAASSGALLPQ